MRLLEVFQRDFMSVAKQFQMRWPKGKLIHIYKVESKAFSPIQVAN